MSPLRERRILYLDYWGSPAMIPCLVLSCALLAPLPSDTIYVGDEHLGSVTLEARSDTVDNYVLRDGQRQLTVVYVYTIADLPDGYLVVEENRQPSGRTITLDSIFLDRHTLAPVWHGEVTPQGRRHVRFASGRMTGVMVDTAGKGSPIDDASPANLFDYSVFTLIADQLPLGEGYSAVVATRDISRGPVYMPIRVLGRDTVDIGGRSYDAWKLEVDLGPVRVTRWVDAATRMELRWTMKRGDQALTGERRSGRE